MTFWPRPQLRPLTTKVNLQVGSEPNGLFCNSGGWGELEALLFFPGLTFSRSSTPGEFSSWLTKVTHSRPQESVTGHTQSESPGLCLPAQGSIRAKAPNPPLPSTKRKGSMAVTLPRRLQVSPQVKSVVRACLDPHQGLLTLSSDVIPSPYPINPEL